MKLNEQGELNEEQLYLINSALSVASVQYRTYLRYYEVDNVVITDEPERKKPDNRVPGGFARKIVNTMKGYAFKAGKITYSTQGTYIDFINALFKANKETLLTSEIAADSLINGKAYEILRVDSEAKIIKQYRILPNTGYAVYDDTLDKNMIAFVHLVRNDVDVNENKYTLTRTVYYDDHFVVYTSNGEGKDWIETERKDHPFGGVPCVVYTTSLDAKPLFYPVLKLIDQHDKIISRNYADDLERFANAYLRMLLSMDDVTVDAQGKTAIDRLNENKIFDGLGAAGEIKNVQDAVDFLVKPSRGEDVAESANRIERLIYDLSMIINPNDPTLSASSGIALRWKAWPMELSAADAETYFAIGLQRRFDLIANAATELRLATPEDVNILFSRNVPLDYAEIFANAGAAKGIISDESILNTIPSDIVPDKKAELLRLANQAPVLDDKDNDQE